MSGKSKIEWTERTWNPVTGCTKVSTGCKYCYAERQFPRMKHMPGYEGRTFKDVAIHDDRMNIPLKRKKPTVYFVNSMSDLFHEDLPLCGDGSGYDVHDIIEMMRDTPQHFYQILTKRPERVLEYAKLAEELFADEVRNIAGGIPHEVRWSFPDNVALGVSAEDQDTFDKRIPLLLQFPVITKFVSLELLLGPIKDIEMYLNHFKTGHVPNGPHGHADRINGKLVWPNGECPMPAYGGNDWCGCGIDWVIVGGESGPKARPMHPQWVRDLRDRCKGTHTPFFFKQWGEWSPTDSDDGVSMNRLAVFNRLDNGDAPMYLKDLETEQRKEDWVDSHDPNDVWMYKVGKEEAGHLLDGKEYREYPAIMKNWKGLEDWYGGFEL